MATINTVLPLITAAQNEALDVIGAPHFDAQITALQAQVSALQAQLAAVTTARDAALAKITAAKAALA